ncbi:MAG TPA: hypothetical protein ENI23_14860 [bacterium]|nr:hypothetical protein [bacterium]
MKREKLIRAVKKLGYPLFETEKILDANETLAEVVKSKDPRLLEGFPLLLANSLEKNLFDYRRVYVNLKEVIERKIFRNLVVMSLALYKYIKLNFSYIDVIYGSNYFDKKLFDKFLNRFKNKKDLTEIGRKLSSVRIVNTFKNYYKYAEPDFRDYVKMRDEFDLEYAFSQVFSKKQKDLFMKRLKGEKMTKTEREYYSRSVKKKVQALANSDLHKLAATLIKK